MLLGAHCGGIGKDSFRVLLSWEMNEPCYLFGIVDDGHGNDCFFD